MQLCVAKVEAAQQFMAKAGHMCYSLAPGVRVETIRYHGKARLAQLDDLFYRYAKATSKVSEPIALISMLEEYLKEEEDLEEYLDEEEYSSGEGGPPLRGQEHTSHLGRLQFLFGMTDRRRGRLEQRIIERILGVLQEEGQHQEQEQEKKVKDRSSISIMLDDLLYGPAWDAAASAPGVITLAIDPWDSTQIEEVMWQCVPKWDDKLPLKEKDALAYQSQRALMAGLRAQIRRGEFTRQDALELEKKVFKRPLKEVLAVVDCPETPEQEQEVAWLKPDMVATCREMVKLSES